MSMLSSVAERLYWMSRYLERTQDTARLIQAYNHLIMDIPKGAEPPWDIMIDILDAQPLFRARFKAGSEQNVLKFLIADDKASCGIPFAVKAARENVRTTRDVLPEEAWELVNELHLFVEAHARNASGRRNRHDFLSEVISRCQMINGLLGASLPRDHAYGFIKLGRLVECADMTTRIMDVGAGDIMERAGRFGAIDPLLWGALLQALSAAAAYRREVGPIIEKDAALNFIFLSSTFPRSIKYFVRETRKELMRLNNHDLTIRAVERLRRRLTRLDAEHFMSGELHDYIEDFQLQLTSLDAAIQATWFSWENT